MPRKPIVKPGRDRIRVPWLVFDRVRNAFSDSLVSFKQPVMPVLTQLDQLDSFPIHPTTCCLPCVTANCLEAERTLRKCICQSTPETAKSDLNPIHTF